MLQRQVGYLKRTLAEHEEFINQLEDMPVKDILAFVHSHRSRSKPLDAYSSLDKGKETAVPLPLIGTVRDILPPNMSDIEIELTNRHPIAYPMLIPIDPASIRLSSAGETIWKERFCSLEDRPIQAATICTATSLSSRERLAGLVTPDAALVRQLRAGRYCDNRLHKLRINHWTEVPISDAFAAAVISHFLQTNHAVVGQFDADLFLTDLVERRARFCSPFLVSCYMYLACVSVLCSIGYVYVVLTYVAAAIHGRRYACLKFEAFILR